MENNKKSNNKLLIFIYGFLCGANVLALGLLLYVKIVNPVQNPNQFGQGEMGGQMGRSHEMPADGQQPPEIPTDGQQPPEMPQ